MLSIIKEQKCMSHILNALWNTLELCNTGELITVTNAPVGIKKKEEKK